MSHHPKISTGGQPLETSPATWDLGLRFEGCTFDSVVTEMPSGFRGLGSIAKFRVNQGFG